MNIHLSLLHRRLLLGLLGAAIVVTGVAVPFLMLRYQRATLLSQLPENDTIAYWAHATQQDLLPYADWFPVLKEVPFPGRFDLALLMGADQKISWVMDNGVDSFKASAPETSLLLNRKDAQSLLGSATHAALTQNIADDDTRVYLALRWMRAGDDDGMTRLLGALRPGEATHALITESLDGGRSLRLRYNESRDVPRASAETSVHVLSPVPVLSISLAEPSATLIELLAHLPDDRRRIAEGILGQRAADAFGDNVSLAHDVLPLLATPGVVHLRTSDGTPSFLLEARSPGSDAGQRLAFLHESLSRDLGSVSVLEREFEGGHNARILRHEQDAARTEDEKRPGWTVRITRDGGGTPRLLSALGNGKLLLSNDVAWFDALTSGDPVPETSAPRTLLRGAQGAGVIDASLLRSVLPEGSRSPAALAMDGHDGSWIWTAEATENVLALTLKPLNGNGSQTASGGLEGR